MKVIWIGVLVVSTILLLGLGGGLTTYYLLFDRFITPENFEKSLGEWEVDRDVPLDPNNPGHEVNWTITRVLNANRATSGEYSLQLFIDGSQDDGTIWIEKAFPVSMNSTYRVTISFQFYCGTESFNQITYVVAYCSTANPEREVDFSNLGSGEQAPAWKEFQLQSTIQTEQEELIWIAVGMSVVWETEVTHYLDDLQVKIQSL